jgi:hypothetical protein
VTYNYQLDTLEGCFGQQPCRCGARNCSGSIGKKPQGSGLGPREAWRASARKLLEMRMPPLVALQGLLAEARALGMGPSTSASSSAAAVAAAVAGAGDGGNEGKEEGEEAGGDDGGEEYAALVSKAAVAEGWLARYRQLMGGWREETEEGEGAAVAVAAAVASKPEPPAGEDGGAAAADCGGGAGAAAGCALVEAEALAALVAEAPRDVKFPEATQARNLLTKARQVRA